MDFVSYVLRRVFSDLDVDSFHMRFIWNTIGLHTAPLGFIPITWKYCATQFLQQMER